MKCISHKTYIFYMKSTHCTVQMTIKQSQPEQSDTIFNEQRKTQEARALNTLQKMTNRVSLIAHKYSIENYQ